MNDKYQRNFCERTAMLFLHKAFHEHKRDAGLFEREMTLKIS